MLSSPANYPQDAETHRYFGQADPNDVAYLRNDAPFQHQRNLFDRYAVYMSSQAYENEFSEAANSDDPGDLENSQLSSKSYLFGLLTH